MNLSAVRIGDSVHLAWTMPTRTTDRIALKHPVTVQVCRAVESGPCANVGTLNLPPGAAGTYADALPPDLTRSPDRLLRYEVALRNHAGKSAGPSNAAYSAAGACPATLTGLTGQVRSDGVVLSWRPAADPGRSVFFRIERQQLNAPAPDEVRRSPLAPRRASCCTDARSPQPGRLRPGSCDRYLRPLQPAVPLCGRTSRNTDAFREDGRGAGTSERVYPGYDQRHLCACCSPGAGRGGRFSCRRHRSLLVARH